MLVWPVLSSAMNRDSMIEESRLRSSGLKAWRFFASLALMAAIWGLLMAAVVWGKLGFFYAILLALTGPFAAISHLGVLISAPVLQWRVRLLICASLLTILTYVMIAHSGMVESVDSAISWGLMIVMQFGLVAAGCTVVTRLRQHRLIAPRNYSLWGLIATVTTLCIGLGVLRAIAVAGEMTFASFKESQYHAFIALTIMNAGDAMGPTLALLPTRRRYRVLLLVLGVPQAILLTIAVLGVHDWAIPNQPVLPIRVGIFFAAAQAMSVSLSLLPILLAPSDASGSQADSQQDQTDPVTHAEMT
ncbi:MAG: hypothetical protein ACIALR_02850 [Blastopirellula sp. JB062]